MDDDDFDEMEPCKYWDEDGLYCVCGNACTCFGGQPAPRVVDISDDLHHLLGEALRA